MSKFLQTLCVMVGICIVPSSVMAQLTIDECQRLAFENYPLLKQYQLIEESTEFTIKNINKGYLPQLTFVGQASYQSDVTTMPESLTKTLTQNGSNVKGLDKDQYCIGVDLNQTIWDGGTISAQKKVAYSQGNTQSAQTDVSMYEIRGRVNNLFFGILLIVDKITLNEDLQTLLQSNCEKLQNMYKNGIAMQADVDVVRAEYLKVRQQHTELLSMKLRFQQMLAIFIGKHTNEIVNLQKPSASMPVNLENNRPELRLYKAQLQHNDAQQKLLDSSILPHFSLYAKGFYGYPGYDMFRDMFSHDFSLNGIIGIRMTWNIGKLYTLKNDRRKLKAARCSIETDRETFLFNNRLQSAQDNANIDMYRKLMQEDEEIIVLRRSVRQAAETKLEHGVIDVNNLLQEITRENQAKTDQSSHEIEMLKHIYELKHTINQ